MPLASREIYSGLKCSGTVLVNRPPGGGGSDSAANVCRAALSSTPWPDDWTMELDVTRPADPIVKLRRTVPVAGLADAG
jgi:hypothetical protein